MTTLSIQGNDITVTKTRDKYEFKWHATCQTPIKSALCMEAMRLHGFAVSGYGFFGFTAKADPSGLLYHADWSCSTSCD